MASILLAVFAILDILLALIAIVVQAIITVNHGDCAYSKMGSGIWAGLLLLVTAGVLLFIAFKKAEKAHEGAMVICAMTLMACLVMTGVAAGVIYQIYSLQFFDRAGGSAGYIPYVGNLKDWVGQIFLQLGDKFLNQAIYYAQIRLCYCFPITDYFGRTRRSLEGVLLGFGLIAIVVNTAAMVTLRLRRKDDDDSSPQVTPHRHGNPPVRQLPSSRL